MAVLLLPLLGNLLCGRRSVLCLYQLGLPLALYDFLVLPALSSIELNQVFTIGVYVVSGFFDLLLRLLKLFPSSLVLIFKNLQFLNDLSKINKRESPPFQLLIEPFICFFEYFIDGLDLLLFEVVAYLAEPLYRIAVDAHIVEIIIGKIVLAVTAGNRFNL